MDNKKDLALVLENMYTQDEVWIYAAIYFILCICSCIGFAFIVLALSMLYLMEVDHFFHHLKVPETYL